MGQKRKHDKHLPQRMYLRSGSYYFVDHKGKWHNLGKVYVKAMAQYAQITDPDKICRTIGDLLDRYLIEIAPTKSERTLKDNMSEAKKLREALGHIQIDQLTTQLVYQYLDARGKKAPVRANREMSLLSSCYTKAIRWGYTTENPCKGVEKHKEKPRNRYVENWEYLAFRGFADPLIASLMDFIYLTGLRISDVVKIKLTDLKDDGIHVQPGKTQNTTGKKLIIEWTPLLSEAVQNIRNLKRPVTGLYLFVTRRGQPYSYSGIVSIWGRQMDKAVEQNIIKERFNRHDLRAKAASDTDSQHAKQLLGHSSEKITAGYRRKDEKVRPIG